MDWNGAGQAWIAVLYAGIGSVGVAYTLQAVGQQWVPPTRASLIMSLESVFSVIGGALLLGETMTVRGYLGCALIFAGIVLAQMAVNKTGNGISERDRGMRPENKKDRIPLIVRQTDPFPSARAEDA